MGFEKPNTQDPHEAVENAQLEKAIEMGVLQPGATRENLSTAVRQEMLDQYTIKDAIKLGLLEEGATGKDLTVGIRSEIMKSNGGCVYQFRGSEIVCRKSGEEIE